MEIVHIVGSGDLRIFRIIIELDTEIVFLVSLLLMLADETEIVVSHDKDLYRDFVYRDGSKLVHGHLERTVTADNDNLLVRRTHLRSDSGRDGIAHGSHAAACEETAVLHHIVVGRPELVLTDIRNIDRIIVHLLREMLD